MVLGGLRRGEVFGMRLEDLRVAERRVFIADGTLDMTETCDDSGFHEENIARG